MKTFLLSALVALSLGLNAVLLLALTSPETVAPLTSMFRAAASTGASTPPARPRTGSATSGGARSVDSSAARWTDLKSDDPATLVANLRAAGFSDLEIRAILSYQLGQKVTARRRELAGPQPDIPYWRSTIGPSPSSLANNPQAQAELRAMSKENAQLMDSLLGPAPANPGLTSAMDRLQFADLPSDKVDQLKQINSDYSDLINAVQSSAIGAMFPEDRAKLKLLNEEKDKDLRALLTPDEYDNYLLRSSNTASNMRSNLQAFQPTEEEFRKIFAVQYAFDQQYNPQGGIDLELARQRAQAQADLNAQIKAVLSPDRVADYEKSTDGTYRQALALTTRLDLPAANATQIWSLQKDTQQRMTALRTDRTLNVDARNQALAALQQDVTSRAAGILGGQRGLDAYKVNGGQWMQNIVPPTPAPGGAGGGGGGGGAPVFISGGTVIIGP